MKRNTSIQKKGASNTGISLTYVAATTIKAKISGKLPCSRLAQISLVPLIHSEERKDGILLLLAEKRL